MDTTSQTAGQPQPQTPPPAPPSAPSAPPPMGDKQDIEQNKVLAAVGYLGILFLIPLLAAKQSKFAQFHAKQGLVLFVVEVILGFVPFLGWALELVLLVVSIYGLVQALQGQWWELPYLGQYAKKINL
jgi:uncharacterized membrane protein